MSRMSPDVTIGLTIEGPILHVAHSAQELTAQPGVSFDVPVKIFRSAKLSGSVQVELRPPACLAGLLKVEPMVLPPEKKEGVFRVTSVRDSRLVGKHLFTLCATALQRAELPRLSRSSNNTPLDREVLDHLRGGWLPVISETAVPVEFSAFESGRPLK